MKLFNITAGANWKEKPVDQWSADDVTLWICSLMNTPSRSLYDGNYPPAINVAAYLNLTGAELMHMSSTEMQSRDPQSGNFVFMSLQQCLSQPNSPYSPTPPGLPSYGHLVSVLTLLEAQYCQLLHKHCVLVYHTCSVCICVSCISGTN